MTPHNLDKSSISFWKNKYTLKKPPSLFSKNKSFNIYLIFSFQYVFVFKATLETVLNLKGFPLNVLLLISSSPMLFFISLSWILSVKHQPIKFVGWLQSTNQIFLMGAKEQTICINYCRVLLVMNSIFSNFLLFTFRSISWLFNPLSFFL